MLLSTYAVLFALLGGLQTPARALIGALVFTLVPELLRSTDQWRYVGFGVCIVLLMLLRPEGLLTRQLIHRLPRWENRMKPLLFLHGVTLTFGGLSVIDNLDYSGSERIRAAA